MGFGRSSERVANTPFSGLPKISPRVHDKHVALCAMQPGQHDEIIADPQIAKSFAKPGVEDDPCVWRSFIALFGRAGGTSGIRPGVVPVFGAASVRAFLTLASRGCDATARFFSETLRPFSSASTSLERRHPGHDPGRGLARSRVRGRTSLRPGQGGSRRSSPALSRRLRPYCR
jgi:hypothetical protein